MGLEIEAQQGHRAADTAGGVNLGLLLFQASPSCLTLPIFATWSPLHLLIIQFHKRSLNCSLNEMHTTDFPQELFLPKLFISCFLNSPNAQQLRSSLPTGKYLAQSDRAAESTESRARLPSLPVQTGKIQPVHHLTVYSRMCGLIFSQLLLIQDIQALPLQATVMRSSGITQEL